MRRAFFFVLGCSFLLGCDEPGASLEVTGARALRTPDQRVAVEIDLLAGEGLGGNIGFYCTRVTFPGQEKRPTEVCSADMEDGDSKTVRIVSDRDFKDNDPIFVRVRHAKIDVGRTLSVPVKEPK